MFRRSTVFRACSGVAVAIAALAFAAGADAEDRSAQERSGQAAKAPSGQKGADAPATELHRLPPDSTTSHKLALPGRMLSFVATVGSIRLFDDKGEPQADIAYTSYQLDGADRGARPVTFLFNGGPGSGSVWLHMGAFGPVRVAIPSDAKDDGAPPYPLVANPDSLLDTTDIVFIDPVGTGFSYALPGVFENNPLQFPMGTVWTLKYETLCYLGVLVAGNGSEIVYLRPDSEQEGDSTTIFRSKDYGATWTKDGTVDGISSHNADGSEISVGPKGWTFVTALCQEVGVL